MNVTTSPLSSKYQVTVPAEIRQSLQIDSPDYEIVWIKASNGGIMVNAIKNLNKDENPFASIFGILKSPEGVSMVDSLITERRADAKKNRT